MAALISTNESGGTVRAFVICADRGRDDLVRFFAVAFSPLESRHRHHDSDRALTPLSEANSAAVSPLSFHCSIRLAQTSRTALPIATSAAKTYASSPLWSGPRFVERIR
jgi:hypothetical protein